MIDFLEVTERLKSVLTQQLQKTKIYDRDVAAALELDPQYYAVIKRRNKIPYEAIANYCKKHRISINWILFHQKPQKLNEA
jgi:hypothetical protein